MAMPGDRTVSFAYDASGNMTALAPPGRPDHGFSYTAVDALRSYDPPAVPGSGATSTTYERDADGELLATLLPDSSSVTATWETDLAGKRTGRVAAVTTAIGSTSFGYDAAGRVDTISSSGGTLGYTYDGFLTMSESWAGSISGTVAFEYDSSFRVASVVVNGAPAARQYDGDGLLTATGSLSLGREPATGRLVSTSLGTAATSQSYDGYGALATFSASASGTERYRYALTPDALGRIATKTETIDGVTRRLDYGYDDAGRLATVHVDGDLQATYEYDGNGNRIWKTSAVAEGGTYDDQDRLLAYGEATYTWRPSGDLESRTVAGQTAWYSYDPLGNLIQAALPGGTAIEYLVDGRNRRIGKKVNGALVEGFLYEEQLRPAAWLDGAGAVKARFVYGTRINVPEYMVTSAGTFRIITDHLGSPRLVVNASTGVTMQRMDFDEWGQVLLDTSPGFHPFGFAGGLYDRDTGLVRFGARDYDPSVGRWTSKDPWSFDGGDMNLYAYVANDPVNWTDPEGVARIGSRPLVGLPYGGPSRHDHIWYDDGGNSGFFDDDRVRPDFGHSRDEYDFSRDRRHYDDEIMRLAENEVQRNWDWDWRLNNNCQDYAEAVRRQYDRIVERLRPRRPGPNS